jgi:hypothetical protein
MKKITLIISTTILLIVIFHKKYWIYDFPHSEIIVYNPMYDNYSDFIFSTERLVICEKKKYEDSIKYYSSKIIDYRFSYNEKQERYSCLNDYWEKQSEKLLFYSKAYENRGNIDSAISVLIPALNIVEANSIGLFERFEMLNLKRKKLKKAKMSYFKADHNH